jgi:hypothetical protein
VVERPHVGNRCLHITVYFKYHGWKNGDRAGPLGRSVEHSNGKDGESDVAVLRFLCDSPRLCRLRTEGLVPMSKYWTYRSHAGVYGPNKPSSMLSIDVGFHLLLHWLAWERNILWPMNYSARLGVAPGALILGSRRIHPTLLMTRERLPRTGTAHMKRTSGVCGLAWEACVLCWSGFPLQGVHQFESPWLSDISNRLFVTAIK